VEGLTEQIFYICHSHYTELMQLFTVLCAKFHTILRKKLLLSQIVLKLIFNYKVFSKKFYAYEMFGSREFRTIFWGRAKKYLRTTALSNT